MPARYLLIEFDDEAQAEALRAQIDTATLKGKKFRVVGMFARPTRWCSCFYTTAKYKEWNLQRGAKFGWWVCPTCRRPLVWHRHALVNLLKLRDRVGGVPTTIARGFQTPADPQSHAEVPWGINVESLSICPTPIRNPAMRAGDDGLGDFEVPNRPELTRWLHEENYQDER